MRGSVEVVLLVLLLIPDKTNIEEGEDDDIPILLMRLSNIFNAVFWNRVVTAVNKFLGRNVDDSIHFLCTNVAVSDDLFFSTYSLSSSSSPPF